jgi:hypothetical protein
MLKAGVIETASVEFVSPVVLVPTSDSTLRFCVEYRHYNAAATRGDYTLHRMYESIHSLRDAQIFMTLDCNSEYWQIPFAPEISKIRHLPLMRGPFSSTESRLDYGTRLPLSSVLSVLYSPI